MLKNLASSRKATVLILVLVLTAVGIHFKDIPWDHTTQAWIASLIIGWMATQAAEDIVTKKRISTPMPRPHIKPTIPRNE